MKFLKVGVMQPVVQPDKAVNLAQITAQISELSAQGAKLVLLPELHATPYFCQTERVTHFDLAEPIPGPTTIQLAAVAKKYQVVIVASIFERRTQGLYHNTAVVLEKNGEIAGIYRKMHIPDDPGFYEKFYFTPGDKGFKPISTSVGCLGVLVCWDQWFPEAARLMALGGADLLLYPTAIGWDIHEAVPEENVRQQQAWEMMQRSHAIANGLPVLVSNRVGIEMGDEKNGIEFWGNSFIAGQQGELLAHASSHSPELLITEIDLQRTENVRRIWPFLRDRRIDAYDGLLARYLDDPSPVGGCVK